MNTPRFDPRQIAQGAALAQVGNCLSCHQAEGGAPFAGGYPVATPFGTVYGTNITPDRETGIGGWSLEAFARSMRDGVSRNGHHLYPAFPYTHYRLVDDADMAALYAYIMTRTPVRATPPANDMIPPLGFRPFLAGWKLLFLPDDPLPADPRQSVAWNRGAYLSEGLGHCSGCHSPRNFLGGEERDRAYAGGWSAGWYAPPLNAQSPAVREWTVGRLDAYLRTGLSVHHAAAAGPMGDVTRNLARAPATDVRAIAEYYAWWMRDAPAARAEPRLPDRAAAAARAHPRGAVLFAGACASCHEPGAAMMVAGRPALPLGTPLHEDNPRDTIMIVLEGLESPAGRDGPMMPAYAEMLTDQEIAELTGYMQVRYRLGPPWRDLVREVADTREESSR